MHPVPRTTYHHGDLRQALLDQATGIIRDDGLHALSMRKLADQVGVSRTAAYHHFKDKNALLCAIAEQGFLQQDKALRALTTASQPLPAEHLFRTYVLAYLRFANQQPETYDLMFGREIWKKGEPTDSLQRISRASFRTWVEWIEQLQRQQLFPGQQPALRIAQASWASLHGLCRLFNDGIYVHQDDLEAIADTMIKLLIQPGIAK